MSVRGSLLGCSLPVVLLGCGPDSVVIKPTVSVYRIDEVNDCVLLCEQGANVENDLGAPNIPECAAPGDTTSNNVDCTFESGRDEAWVIVDYGDVIFGSDVPKTTLKTRVGGVELETSKTLSGVKAPSGRAYAVARVMTPLQRRGSLAFVATIADNYESIPDGSLTLDDPRIDLSFVGCDSDCSFPAGAGQAKLSLSVPAGVETVTLVSEINNVQQGESKEFTVSEQLDRTFEVALDVPDRPMNTWTVLAHAESVPMRPEVTAQITERQPLRLWADAFDTVEPSGDGDFPDRIALEPLLECRQVMVHVQGEHAVVGQQVTVEVSEGAGAFGSLGTQSTTLTFMEPEDGSPVPEGGLIASSLFELSPELISSGRVVFTAKSAEFGDISRTWTLEGLQAESAELFAPGSPQMVNANGTTEQVVTGFLRAPSVDSEGSSVVQPEFSGTEVFLRVIATGNPDALPLECGVPDPDVNINCDRRPGEERGGCIWTTEPITVDSDGGFSETLPSGRCFVGRIDLRVYARTYSPNSTGQCLGTSPVGEVELLAEAPTITYEAVEPDETTTGASTTGE